MKRIAIAANDGLVKEIKSIDTAYNMNKALSTKAPELKY